MGMMEMFLIAVGLSMDACAVAVCKGLGMTRVNRKQAVMIALFFGVFQGGMPLIGWALGTQFEQYIVSVDHWIALILLGLIGGNMIRESFGKEEEEAEMDAPLNYKELTLMAVATSIDALAVGVTLAFLRVNIVPAVSFIGVITFVMSLAGVYVGNFFGARYKKRAERLGGAILILMGLKIFLEHMGIIG